jgi:hypothetical protein
MHHSNQLTARCSQWKDNRINGLPPGSVASLMLWKQSKPEICSGSRELTLKVDLLASNLLQSRLKYVTWNNQKEFMTDLKTVYQAPTREEAETNLLTLAERWGKKYGLAVKSWENHWAELSTYFDFPAQIRRLI